MIRNKGEGPYVPRWFLRELKLISPNFSVLWSNEWCKFVIVSPAPVNAFREGYIVEFVVEEKDGSYAPLDSVTLEALRMAMQGKDLKFCHLITEMRQQRIRRWEKAHAYRVGMSKEFEKKVYEYQHKETYL